MTGGGVESIVGRIKIKRNDNEYGRIYLYIYQFGCVFWGGVSLGVNLRGKITQAYF